MYREIEKMFPVKLPVTKHKDITELHLKRFYTNNPELENDIHKYILFYNANFDNIKEYINFRNSIVERLVSLLKNSDLYKYFNNRELDRTIRKIKGSNRVIDTLTNIDTSNKIFINVDIIEGNFSIIKFISSSINSDETSKAFNSSLTFKNFIDKISINDTFSDKEKLFLDFAKNSKGFRQVVFGQLNPNRTTLLLSDVINTFKDDLIVMKDIEYDIILDSQDEITIMINKEDKDILLEKLNFFLRHLKFRVEEIEFNIIDGLTSFSNQEAKKYYIESRNGKKTLKGVPKDFYIPLYVKHILEEDTISNDFFIQQDSNIFEFKIFN